MSTHEGADARGGTLTVRPTGRLTPVIAVAVAMLLVVEVLARVTIAGAPPPLRWYDAAAELRVQMMQARGQTDVVFAGTSMAWQDMVPAVFEATDDKGRTAFNVGLAGAVPAVTGPWLLSTVVPRLQPRTVVWGLSSLDLAPAYGEGPISAWEQSPSGRRGPLGVAERTGSQVSILVRRRAELRRPSRLSGAHAKRGDGSAQLDTDNPQRQHVDALQQDRVDAARLTGPDGERLAFDTQPFDTQPFDTQRDPQSAAVQRARLDHFTPDPTDLADIARTVTALSDQGIEVVLADLPVPPAFVALHPGGQQDVDRTRRALAILAEELRVPFVPVDRAYVDADFVDFTHLTRTAATGFTLDLTRAIAAGSASLGGNFSRPTDDAPPGTESVQEWVGATTATDVLRPLRQAAISQVGCAGEELPAEDLTVARQQVARLGQTTLREDLTTLLRRAEELAVSCSTQDGWRAAMREVIRAAVPVAEELQTNLGVRSRTSPGAQGATQALDQADDAALAGFVAQAYDRLFWLVEGAGRPRLSRNEVWWSFAQRGNHQALVQAATEGRDIDTLVFGTSQARSGVLADPLGFRTGATVFNAAIDGGTVNISRMWAPQAVQLAAPERAVVVVSGIDFLTVVGPPCPTIAEDGFRTSTQVTDTAFDDVPWLTGTSGPAVASSTDADAPLRSPLIDAYGPDPQQDYPSYDEETIMRRGQVYLAAYRKFTPCDSRLDDLQLLVADLGRRGVQVTVIAHPVRSQLREAAPPGMVQALDDRIRAHAQAGGAEFFSYTALLPDDQMADLVHVGRDGAVVLTNRLAEDLRR